MCTNGSTECACAALESQPEGLPAAALGDGLRRLARLRARADARYAAWIAEAEHTGAAEAQGFRSTTEWLAALSGEPLPVARSQVAVAAALEAMPETRKAFQSGALPESRVRVLAQAQALAPEQFAGQEKALVAEIAAADSRQVPGLMSAWKQTADPDAAQAAAERLHQMRALHVSSAWTGMVHLNGDLDPAGGLIVLEALRSLSEGAALDPADTRSPAQARADALVEICQRHLHADPKGRRQPSRVLVTIPWNTLQAGQGLVDTEAGPISAETARRLACDATISRVLLDAESVPVEMGRATRVVPDRLRKLLEARDQHCTHPGCHIPARWCDAHHIVHWAKGGSTGLSNLRLLCSRHHTEAHQHDQHHRRQ